TPASRRLTGTARGLAGLPPPGTARPQAGADPPRERRVHGIRSAAGGRPECSAGGAARRPGVRTMNPRHPKEGLPALADWLTPDWQPHPRVRACVTTRTGSFSPPPWHGFNLGANCGDTPERVERAR